MNTTNSNAGAAIRPHQFLLWSRAALLLAILAVLTAGIASASTFTTPVLVANLDAANYKAWTGGAEVPVGLPTDGPQAAICTQTTSAGGVLYGDSNSPGLRYLRIGFNAPVTVGSVVACGGGTLSVLKANAPYPGRLDDDSEWIEATRLSIKAVDADGIVAPQTVTQSELSGEAVAVWVLPPGTTTRALRFSHTALLVDKIYGCSLRGAFVFSQRFVNLAGLATAFAGTNSEYAGAINNDIVDTYAPWNNGVSGGTNVVSPAHPEWLVLAWKNPVRIAGLCAFSAGFGTADAQTLLGSNAAAAKDTDWETVASFSGISTQFPHTFGPNWMDFGSTLTTRAIRLRMTSKSNEWNGNMTVKQFGGKRIWLGELMALAPLGDAPLQSILPPAGPVVVKDHPPIPVHFTLKEAGYVTLVIDDETGHRIRNLVSETKFPAGDNVVWWDGLDDIGRDPEAANHSIYHIPGKLVAAATYRVRGLVRQDIDLRYQFAVYNHGNPPWATKSQSSMWLANHSAPNAVAFVPAGVAPQRDGSSSPSPAQMLVGSEVTEGGSALAWLDMQGNKLFGIGWLGGTWTGAHFLTSDRGPKAVPGVYAYTATEWRGGNHYGMQPELRVQEIINPGAPGAPKANSEDPNLLTPHYPLPDGTRATVSGLAAYNGVVVISMVKMDQLIFLDAMAHKAIGTADLTDPHGVVFDSQGRLLALAAGKLLRYTLAAPIAADTTGKVTLGPAETLVGSGLDDPQNLTTDSAGNIYVSEQGASHDVKVFAADGKQVRTIGVPGPPAEGPYDPGKMRNPSGLAIDDQGRLWVAENSFQPKRVSIWTLDGKFVDAYYGPHRYGEGGELDPTDKSIYYYGGMTFKIDWTTGKNWPINIFWLGDASGPHGNLAFRAGFPETPILYKGAKYFTNCFNCGATTGSGTAFLWKVDDGVAKLAAGAGIANEWDLLKADTFKSAWPAGLDLNGPRQSNLAYFIWTDLNGDGKPEPDEVQFVKISTGADPNSGLGAMTIEPDLSFSESRLGTTATRFAPVSFTSDGFPRYDATKGIAFAQNVQPPSSDGGNQALAGADGWTLMTAVPKPYSRLSIAGVHNGEAMWSYPSLWPGLHPSHNAGNLLFPGELIGTTHLIGYPVVPPDSDAGPLFAINSNEGEIYLFTGDGLFAATLFKDGRTASWNMPVGIRDMLVTDCSIGAEDFYPQITQEADGTVYLQAACGLIVRVDGLNTIKRLPDAPLRITAAQLAQAQAYFISSEANRQAAAGADKPVLIVGNATTAPTLDGDLADWSNADWATIDVRQNTIGWGHSEDKIQGALSISGSSLYAAYKTGDPRLLNNSGVLMQNLFKSGGALDLMIDAVPGGERLLVTLVNGKTAAMLYRPHDPASKTQPVQFSSPLSTIAFDLVEDVSNQVKLTADKTGDYEFSVPLSVLGLSPTANQTIKGDIGLLRGDGVQTLQRVYWRNKATGIVSDTPSEAALTPSLWGEFTFSQ